LRGSAGRWWEAQRQRMDAVIVIEQGDDGGTASCRKLRDIVKGDRSSAATTASASVPEFRERDRHGFAFMTNEISPSAASRSASPDPPT